MSNFVPLTLSIIPTTTSQVPAPQVTTLVPNFDYGGYPNNSEKSVSNFVGGKHIDELEQRRLQRGREKSARYETKVKEYKKLGTLDSEKEKIKGLLLICRPHLKTMNPADLDLIIDQIVRLLP